jgi:glycosyltransferase involved in cell wall biosynthesis
LSTEEDEERFARIALVIPALEPSPSLLDYLAKLRSLGFSNILLVDDGSGHGFKKLFDDAAEKLKIDVITLNENQGKGAALKVAFSVAAQIPEIAGVVTADSDGQHSPRDIVRVAEQLLADSSAGAVRIILGTRSLRTGDVPWKSKLGNTITSALVKMLFGIYLSDTQTGLRGIPTEILTTQGEVRGNRFEYEMGSLFKALADKVPVVELPIETIYPDGKNKETHFRPLVDSAKIYFVIFGQFMGFASSSLLSFAVDIALFVFIIDSFFEGAAAPVAVVSSVIFARIGSSLVNFTLNKRLVFENKDQKRKTLARYYLVAITILGFSASGSAVMAQVLDGRVVWAKILVDTALFILSYLIQRRWVFKKGTGKAAK